MIHKAVPFLIASTLCSTHLLVAKAKPIADADIPKVSGKDLVSYMTPLEGTTPAQWRVIWKGDASTEATISWSTAEEGSKHRVLYGTDDQTLDKSLDCQVNSGYTVNKGDKSVYYHHARLSGLKPDTDYHFAMESDGKRSRQLYFRTAPASGTGFSIIHGGDSRSGHTDRCRMNLRIAAIARDNRKVLAFAHGGDYIVSGKVWKQWRLWLSQHELTTAEDGRVLPIIPTWGNHDGGVLYFEIFDLDQKMERWYTTQLGKDVAMVTLDTNSPAGGEQAEWLEKQLKELRPKNKWLMVQYHRPMYPAVKSPARHAPVFCPLFDEFGVDLALEADGHCMKRTVPIRDGKAHPEGLVYLGEGGLGVGQRKTDGKRWYFQDGGKAGSAHHIVLLDITDPSMRSRFILMDGKVWDDYTIKVRK